MKTSRVLFVLLLLVAPAVFAQSTHSVWSNKPLMVKDGVTNQSFNALQKGSAAFAWTENSPYGYARAVGVVNANLVYDFRLRRITGSPADQIEGLWDVFKNGVNVCSLCIGKAYGLSQAANAGKYFKIYVGTPAAYAEKWHYSGYITSRFDF